MWSIFKEKINNIKVDKSFAQISTPESKLVLKTMDLFDFVLFFCSTIFNKRILETIFKNRKTKKNPFDDVNVKTVIRLKKVIYDKNSFLLW